MKNDHGSAISNLKTIVLLQLQILWVRNWERTQEDGLSLLTWCLGSHVGGLSLGAGISSKPHHSRVSGWCGLSPQTPPGAVRTPALGLSTWPGLPHNMAALNFSNGGLGLQRWVSQEARSGSCQSLRAGPGNEDSVTFAIFYWSRQPQSMPRFKGKGHKPDPKIEGVSISHSKSVWDGRHCKGHI